jgi:SAM-dependent methyltransferase
VAALTTRGASDRRVHEWGTAPGFVGPRHALRERLLLRELLARRPGRRVLDAGAGGGSFARLLSQRGFAVTATDASPSAVAVLRAGGVDAVEADVSALPFDDGAFDAVVLGEVLEHVEHDGTALAEVARVLCPAGVLALSVPRNPAWFGASDRWAGHVRRYTKEALLDVVRGAGFESVRCRPWGFPVSTLYHRFVYEPRVARRGAEPLGAAQRPALAVLGGALQIDRAFVGVERGALGYLLTAVSHKPATDR